MDRARFLLCTAFINRAAMGQAGSCSATAFINRAAMGRARFLLFTLFIFFRFVDELNQTSTRPYIYIVSGTSNHAIYYVYSPKAVKTLMYLKFYEYSTLYSVQNILPFVLLKRLIRSEY